MPGGVIVKTGNGGKNWDIAYSVMNYPFYSVCFSDIIHGFAVGGGFIPITPYHSLYARSYNGGSNWQGGGLGNDILFCVYFKDISTGYIGGEKGKLFKTTNGGNNWMNLASGTSNYIRTIRFINDTTGLFAGDACMGKTTNGGTTWFALSYGTYSGINSICFPDANKGYAVDTQGNIFHTTDGGLNWLKQSCFSPSSLNSVFFTDASTGYAVGNYGLIIKTTNGGDWIGEKTLAKYDFTVFPNPAYDKIIINIRGFQNLSGLNFSIYNIQGQLLFQRTITQNYSEINIKQLKPGVYIACLVVDGIKCCSQKIIKENFPNKRR